MPGDPSGLLLWSALYAVAPSLVMVIRIISVVGYVRIGSNQKKVSFRAVPSINTFYLYVLVQTKIWRKKELTLDAVLHGRSFGTQDWLDQMAPTLGALREWNSRVGIPQDVWALVSTMEVACSDCKLVRSAPAHQHHLVYCTV